VVDASAGVKTMERSGRLMLNLVQTIMTKVYNRTLLRLLLKRQLESLPELIRHLIRVQGNEAEYGEILDVVTKEPCSLIPYKFVDDYKNLPIEVDKDERCGLPFAALEGAKVYFPGEFGHKQIRQRVRQSLWEQAPQSPHRYFHDSRKPFSGRYAVLAGASDCIYALKIIPYFDKVFMFEPDRRWHAPMKATLAGFGDKANIVPKRVGAITSGKEVSLDQFFEGEHEKVDYIQADIEGAELALLQGAERLIEKSPRLAVSICCYHHASDEKHLGDFLVARGLTVKPSAGYMLAFMQYPLHYPYLRRGVLYATKTGSGA
jgi:hypothetical protein